jgi:hypothetical protein
MRTAGVLVVRRGPLSHENSWRNRREEGTLDPREQLLCCREEGTSSFLSTRAANVLVGKRTEL